MNFLPWLSYFESNKHHFDHLDWNNDVSLMPLEKALISSSVQQFQRGEYSEGKHFRQFAKNLRDETYLETVKIFIREEQDHANVLGRFMDMQGIARIKRDWLDNVFRRLRKLAGLEGTVTVLLTAEIISMVYYNALMRATSSRLLQQICRQILKDEEMHLRFQCYTLGIIYERKGLLSRFFASLIHTVLMAGTIIMVWWFHRKVLKAGGYGLLSFFIAVWKEFRQCRLMTRKKAPAQPRLVIPINQITNI